MFRQIFGPTKVVVGKTLFGLCLNLCCSLLERDVLKIYFFNNTFVSEKKKINKCIYNRKILLIFALLIRLIVFFFKLAANKINSKPVMTPIHH